MSQAQVAILMGSDSDWAVMEACHRQLADLGVRAEVHVRSAHRTPDDVHEFARTAADRGVRVIIAGAGMSAALAGTIAAATTLPVIGVPLESGSLGGVDALLSTVQMPPGVPVAGVGLGKAGARNAAILAAQILALSDAKLAVTLKQFKTEQAEAVRAKDRALQERLARD